VAAILANPRYTGRQIWNRQHIDHNETVAGEKATSRGSVFRWNPKDQWVVSSGLAHPALVSEEDFVKAQAVTAVPTPSDGRARRYLLTGLVVCEVCGRRADGHWSMIGPATGVDMGGPAPARLHPAGRRRFTGARTSSSSGRAISW